MKKLNLFFILLLASCSSGSGEIELPENLPDTAELCKELCSRECSSVCVQICPDTCQQPTVRPEPRPTPETPLPPVPDPRQTPAEDELPDAIILPDSACQKGSDGGYGYLWKPISESTKNAVLLMSKAYKGETLEFSDLTLSVDKTRCCDTNGDRMHWWLSKPGSAIQKNLRVDFSGGDCLIVTDPSKRVD